MDAHERRWPASVAVGAVIALQVALPQRVIPPWWHVVGVVEVVLLGIVVAGNPVRLARDHPVTRAAAVGVAVLLLVANMAQLGWLLAGLLRHVDVSAGALVAGGALIWCTNIVATAVAYWEMDRGGPFARDPGHRRVADVPDLLFPQMTDGETGWRPSFVDYLFVAFTSATAFSPTDAMPMTGRAKVLMMAAATVSLATIAGVAARAVNVL